ncbi:MAG: BrnT family toxin [Neisseriaceae bacterium]|nr:BrnT family toxin [Neisseriaceae bacterium]
MQNDFFEWDEDKADANYRKHGVSFDEACTVFDDAFAITRIDNREKYNELRLCTIGRSTHGRLLSVVWTERNDRSRIISAFIATAERRKIYENHQQNRRNGRRRH